MNIQNKPISWYIERLQNNQPFSLVHFGDGEWTAVFKNDGHEVGRFERENAEGTIYTEPLCDELARTLEYKADNFFVATPDDLKYIGMAGQVDDYLKKRGMEIEFHEKDVWNKASVEGELGPFIKELRNHRVCVISNEAMRGLYFLNYNEFTEINYPNAYIHIDTIIDSTGYRGSNVYIVAAGLAGPCIVRRLHEQIGENGFIIEIGSIFDGFVGMGGQRGSRSEMYANPRKLMEWRRKNLNI